MKDRHGRIEIITGPMFCGKTEELIRRIQRLKIAGYTIQVFHPAIDKRYGLCAIRSHSGASVESIALSGVGELLETLDESKDCFAIDEIQFLEAGVVNVVDGLRQRGKIVLVSGLNQDFTGKPFKFKGSDRHMGELIAMADNIIHLTAVCTHKEGEEVCESVATRTQRLVDGRPAHVNDPIVLVGGKESYEARCPKHHFVRDD